MNNIALLTDFGTSDWYVGVMKGVAADVYPDVRFIDITHDIRPQHVQEAAFVLWNAYRYFPEGTVFTCVVDPGVGSMRNIIAVKASGYYFIAPDNGLLNMVLPELDIERAVVVNNPVYFRKDVSNTFHGRDIFAPVSAHIANGTPLEELGETYELPGLESPLIEVQSPGRYKGRIVYIDHFGNLVTNFKVFHDLKGEVAVGDYWVEKMVNNYSEVEKGEMLALVGSSGLLEISVRGGNAEKTLHVNYAEPVYLQV